MDQQKLQSWIPLLLKTVVSASETIMAVYQEDFDKMLKTDGSPVTIADLKSNEILQKGLLETGLPIISEESVHEPYSERQHWETLWCVDPLDGTKEFIKQNDEFAICVALIHQQQPVFGMIVSPVLERILLGGAWYAPRFLDFDQLENPDDTALLRQPKQVHTPIQMAGSRSHLSGTELKFTNKVREQLGPVEFLKKGSALKFFDLAAGLADVYPRFAPTMEWDIAAGQAILEALGGDVLHAETHEPLRYNKPNLYNPYFIARTAAFKETGVL